MTDASGPDCLESGGGGSLNNRPDGAYLGASVEGLFTVATLERETEGATTSLTFEIVGDDDEVDAGPGSNGYLVRLSMTALPSDLVQVGDVLGIRWTAVDDADDSTLIITRDEALLFFAARERVANADADSLLATLEPYGIEISAGDASCAFMVDGCDYREHALRVRRDGDPANVSETGLARIGDLAVAGRLLERLGGSSGCTVSATTLIASGFVAR
jgi:hypothetical protein